MKVLMVMATMLLLFGCGTLRINPKACQTAAVWGNDPHATREITRDELAEERVLNLSAKETFLVFHNRDIRLRDLLEDHGIKCSEVKKVRVEIKTSWFFIREVALKVVKN